MSNDIGTVYDDKFYHGQRGRSASSARVVIPVIKDLIGPRSVLDVGCGIGTWVGAWHESGLDDVLGVDGDYVDRTLLECPNEKFQSHDLNSPLGLGRRFDLVTCLEVAEHLPHEAASILIDSLIRHGDVVVFSAAVPRQGGTHHVNEQWPSYWVAIFGRSGYKPFDLIRPQIWYEDQVEWWYRQNILVFANDDAAERLNLRHTDGPLDIIHPAFFEAATIPVPLTTQLWTKIKTGGTSFVARTPIGTPLRRLKRALSS
jgi:SAM-dependent methyltransferase